MYLQKCLDAAKGICFTVSIRNPSTSATAILLGKVKKERGEGGVTKINKRMLKPTNTDTP